MNRIKKYQIIATILTILLIIISIYFVYDASSIWAKYKYNDSYYYLKRQLIYGIIAVIFVFIGQRIQIEKFKRFYFPTLILSYILLILVLIPGIGIMKGGSYSWLGFSFLTFQPSEIFKLIIILYFSYYLSNNYQFSQKLTKILPLIGLFIVGAILIMLQPDFGTLVVIGGAVFIVLFLSKLKIKYFILSLLIAGCAFTIMIIIEPYRLERITSYIDPFSDPLGSGFQIIQSLYAIGPGGLIGEGINASIQKYYYLPEPQTDFIFAIIVEEFGLIGGLIIILIYFVLFFCLFKIAKYKNNQFEFLLSIGLISLIVIQVIINLGVVTSLFPVTGITLPFLSYGGSSLITLSFSVGLIIGRVKK